MVTSNNQNDVNTFTFIDNAVLYLKEGMKDRENEIQIIYDNEDLSVSNMNIIYNRIFEHSGIPHEGIILLIIYILHLIHMNI